MLAGCLSACFTILTRLNCSRSWEAFAIQLTSKSVRTSQLEHVAPPHSHAAVEDSVTLQQLPGTLSEGSWCDQR